jgi:hypothetical protein
VLASQSHKFLRQCSRLKINSTPRRRHGRNDPKTGGIQHGNRRFRPTPSAARLCRVIEVQGTRRISLLRDNANSAAFRLGIDPGQR